MKNQNALLSVQYAMRVTGDSEIPCHLSEIKQGDVYYQIDGAQKSELFRATGNAFSSDVNNQQVWSIPHEIYV